MGENRKKTKEARLRVVIDTSVLIPALLSSKGHAFEVLELLFEGKIINYYSTSTKAEYYEVISYPKLIKKIPFEVSMKQQCLNNNSFFYCFPNYSISPLLSLKLLWSVA